MKQVKKVLSALLVVVMALALLAGCKKKEEKPSEPPAEPKVDTSWYKESETTFTLTKVAEFYGLAELAQENNFAGKTIKLGADMKLNEVDATTLERWQFGLEEPEQVWTPLGTKDLPFAGNFDGQGYTISGLYVSASEEGAGLFGWTAYDMEIKNFKLIDSCIKNSKSKTGIIGSGIVKKLEDIYTNVIIDTYGIFTGGFIGWYMGGYPETAEGEASGIAENWAQSKMTINRCWFDGTINAGDYAAGGIIGGQNGRAQVNMVNCLVTGTITSTKEGSYERIGGLFGWMNWEADYNITNCLVTSTVTAGTEAYAGAMIGDYGAQPAGPSIKNSYAIGAKVIGNDQKNLGLGPGILKTLEEVKALDIATAFPKLEGETESPWQAVEGSTPILKGMK